MDGGSGGRECESRAGEEQDELDVEDEEKGRRRFLREKDCSACEKWVGRGRGTLDTVVSTATDIVQEPFQLLSLKIVSCNNQEKTIKHKQSWLPVNMNAIFALLVPFRCTDTENQADKKSKAQSY